MPFQSRPCFTVVSDVRLHKPKDVCQQMGVHNHQTWEPLCHLLSIQKIGHSDHRAFLEIGLLCLALGRLTMEVLELHVGDLELRVILFLSSE